MEHTTHGTHPKFVRWALLLGIVIILNIFFNVLISLALPAPQYNDFCPIQNGPGPQTEAACTAIGGSWTDSYAPGEAPPKTVPATPTGYCNVYATCQPIFDAANEKHSLYAFVFMVALGVLSLIAGFMPIGSSIVSSGLSYGGVLALVIGSGQYWGNAGQWVRFAIALLGLIALIYIGWKRFQD